MNIDKELRFQAHSRVMALIQHDSSTINKEKAVDNLVEFAQAHTLEVLKRMKSKLQNDYIPGPHKHDIENARHLVKAEIKRLEGNDE